MHNSAPQTQGSYLQPHPANHSNNNRELLKNLSVLKVEIKSNHLNDKLHCGTKKKSNGAWDISTDSSCFWAPSYPNECLFGSIRSDYSTNFDNFLGKWQNFCKMIFTLFVALMILKTITFI